MPICEKCETQFPNHLKIDGKKRNLQRRKFCVSCSPFGKHNTKNLKVVDNFRCPKCEVFLSRDNFYTRRGDNRSSYCKSCFNTICLERQREIKKKAVDYMGGSCVGCGYGLYYGALEFHHKDPTQKDPTQKRPNPKKTQLSGLVVADVVGKR